jgi:hypothetical protein
MFVVRAHKYLFMYLEAPNADSEIIVRSMKICLFV